jgi:hypothetical protein
VGSIPTRDVSKYKYRDNLNLYKYTKGWDIIECTSFLTRPLKRDN